MAESIHERIKRDRDDALPFNSKYDDITTFREYYRGRQRGTISAAQRKILSSLVGNLWCDNLCRKVVITLSGRVTMKEWVVPNDGVKQFLDVLWVKNAFPKLFGAATRSVIRDGNHALSLRWLPDETSPEGGRVGIYRERWWNGQDGVFVAYDDEYSPAYAVRDWTSYDPESRVELQRRVIWFSDRIERYVWDGGAWKLFDRDGDGGRSLWTRADGTPLGIPVVHLPMGSVEDGPYGSSLLDGGVVGMQDEVNDVQRDITAAARLTGYQMYTATGVQIEKDSQGNTKSLNVGPGRTLTSESGDAKFGVLPAGDLSQLAGALEVKVKALCRMTDTPEHVITGQWPSGEALLRAEMPLVTTAQSLIDALAGPAATVAHRATEIANVFGAAGLDESAMITAEFDPADKRDPLSEQQVLKAKADYAEQVEGLKTRWALRTAGVPEDDIQEILDQQAEAAEMAAAMFDAGQRTGLPPEDQL